MCHHAWKLCCRGVARLLIVSTAFGITALAGAAQADTLLADVAQMMRSGELSGPARSNDSSAQYQSLKKQTPRDARIDYAWAVVLMHQHQYVDALPVLASCIRANPADLDSACWYAWSLAQCRRYDDALAAIGHIGRRTADDQLAPPEVRRRAAFFLGELIAYFELLTPGGTKQDEIGEIKNELLATLRGSLLESLDEGRAKVADQFEKLRSEREAKLAQRASDNSQQQEDTLLALDDKRQLAAENEAKLSKSSERIQDAARELAVLQRQISSLSQDRTLVSTQIIAAQARIANLTRQVDVEIPGVQGDPSRSTGRVITNTNSRTQININDVMSAQQLSLALAVLQKQAFDLDRRLLSLTTRARELQGEGATQSQVAAQSQANIERAKKRASALEKRALQLENQKPTASNITAQMRSLSTYMPLPYKAEKERVLGWFGGP